jgi:hypothetical protein
MLIASTARRAIQELRDDPRNIAAILTHLTDIVEIAEAHG